MLFLRGEQTSPLKWWLWSWDTKGTLLLHILCFTGKSIIQGAKTSIFRQICWASPKGISNAKCHTAVTIYPHEKWHWNCQLLGDPRGAKPVPKPVKTWFPFCFSRIKLSFLPTLLNSSAIWLCKAENLPFLTPPATAEVHRLKYHIESIWLVTCKKTVASHQ